MSRTSFRGVACGLLAVLAMGALASCDAPQPLGPGSIISIEQYIPQVTNGDGTIVATLHPGPAPAASAAAPVVPSAGSAVNGGSASVNVSSGTEFTAVIVALNGVDGYWELVLPAGATASDVVVGITRDLTADRTFRIDYGIVTAGGVGGYGRQSMRVHRVGTGDVQVSVSWTGATDVDLHVYAPDGERIYFANKQGASGGTLDLDSNPGCTIDNVNNENIVWPVGAAPAGTYRVVLDYWSACSQPRSDYVVTVQMAGQPARIFSGSFVGDASDNPDVEIGTFTYGN